jgi:hypothetical protein
MYLTDSVNLQPDIVFVQDRLNQEFRELDHSQRDSFGGIIRRRRIRL